jgi:acetyl esterase/lipase
VTRTFRYGSAAAQVADLYLPARPGTHPVVVLVHGGFWRAGYGRDLMEPLARDLTARGYAAWNIEYRRLGEPGGGWPGTLADAAAAVDALAAAADQQAGSGHVLGLDRVVAVGHSAGGHLALWLAARPGLPATAPGAGPRVPVGAAVSLAGVADLHGANAARLGAGAAAALLGGDPREVPDRYALASPRARLPLGVPQLLLHGDADDRVPVEQSRDHARDAAAAGDAAELVEFPGLGHFELIDPAHPSWAAVLDRLPALAGRPERE